MATTDPPLENSRRVDGAESAEEIGALKGAGGSCRGDPMATIVYQGREYAAKPEESVLDVFLRYGITVPFSCRKGTCHVCLLRCVDGTVSEASQAGLKPELVEAGYFSPCQCPVTGTLVIEPPLEADLAGRRSTDRPGSVRPDIPHTSPPQPDPALWAALGEGTLLMEILQDLYRQIYDDPGMRPFFEGTTMQRAIEKQYNFMYQILTGERVYFGEQPRNAHNWMVISDDLFDRRQDLLVGTARRHGLPDEAIDRWQALDESFRPDIVKDEPRPKIAFGQELPLEGNESLLLEYSTLCDSCTREIPAGEMVSYHVRLGTVYCGECRTPTQPEDALPASS
jgi:ferredoxin/truncated hemoglobin YjbI